MDILEEAARLRHYGLELIKLAADLEADHRYTRKLPAYQAMFPIVDGVEQITGRLACCGAGTDRVDRRTRERLHLPSCHTIQSGSPTVFLAEPDWTSADDEAVAVDELERSGAYDQADR